MRVGLRCSVRVVPVLPETVLMEIILKSEAIIHTQDACELAFVQVWEEGGIKGVQRNDVCTILL